MRLTLLSGRGAPVPGASATVGPHGGVADFHGAIGDAVAIRAAGGVRVGDAVVTSSGPDPVSYGLDGDFQLALDQSRWRLWRTEPTFAVFHATALRSPAWLGDPADGAVTAERSSVDGDSWVNVFLLHSATLVRSDAALPGWRATATNAAGRVLELPVRTHGLVQAVDLPPGRWVVHFHYRAPWVDTALALSLASAGLLAVAALAAVVRRRRGSRVEP